MKYILIYERYFSIINSCSTTKKQFETLKQVEEYILENNIDQRKIIYLGEYKPLKIKMSVIEEG